MSGDKPLLLQMPSRQAQAQNYSFIKYIDPILPRVHQGSIELKKKENNLPIKPKAIIKNYINIDELIWSRQT
jgi:hypothetical protein